MSSKQRGWVPYLLYALLSLAILGPLLLPGYILTLDMVFTPNTDFTPELYGLKENISAGAPLFLSLQLVNKLVPTWLLQKVILFLIFFLAGLGAYRLFPLKGIGSIFAGLLYTLNPFTYTRFLAGHWMLLAAYALTPFAIKAFIDLLGGGGTRSIIKVVIFSTLVGLLQVHGLFLLLLAYFIISVIKLVRERRDSARLLQLSKLIVVTAGAFLVVNLYWLVPVLTMKDILASQINQADLLVFAPESTSTFRVMPAIASMHGFWRGGYVYAKDILPFWWVFFVFILYLVIYGFVCNYRSKEVSWGTTPSGQPPSRDNVGWLVVSFGLIGVVSFLLAVGAASEISKPTFVWLWEHVFFFRGFRDSQKFVALLCLTYAYLGGLGVNEFAQMMREQSRKLLRLINAVLIVVAISSPMVGCVTMFGFYGQLRTIDYPEEWYEVNKYLNQDSDDFNVLVLPWHQYIDYSWLANNDKRLGNPAQRFFNKPVISGDNVEVDGIYSQSTNPISKYVEFLLERGDETDNFGELLAPLNVKYVLLVHEVDYIHYNFLYQQKDLTIEPEREGLTLFRNEHSLARVYGVDSVVYISDWDEYLKLSKDQDVMEHLYIMSNGREGKTQGSNMEALAAERRSPVKYEVEGARSKYTIFTVPQNISTDYWEYNGQKPLKNLGIMPAFESSLEGGDIVYARYYHLYLPSYAASLLALVSIVWYYFWKGRGKRASKETFGRKEYYRS